ncbi:hypothetical protein [Xylanimonas ulmi]|uniref:Secreted protein n=1 Tax=Xylanimonas ulmi TaxID=228973 RepID=A0A4Q7M2B7_9MICO|nr:hypothetical protein [Xylanibacterium ulmi]RZS62015.1 hypothetical protein EV386_2332 [Xylanibacterium ulmi]
MPALRTRWLLASACAVVAAPLAALGNASASHLTVEAQGNAVWSRAWATTPPPTPSPTPTDPLACEAPTLRWASGDATWLQQGSSEIQVHYTLGSTYNEALAFWRGEAENYTVVLVSAEGTSTPPRRYDHWGEYAGVQVHAGDVRGSFSEWAPLERTPYPLVVQLRRPDGSVAACSPVFWWAWSGGTGGVSGSAPEGWAKPN